MELSKIEKTANRFLQMLESQFKDQGYWFEEIVFFKDNDGLMNISIQAYKNHCGEKLSWVCVLPVSKGK